MSNEQTDTDAAERDELMGLAKSKLVSMYLRERRDSAYAAERNATLAAKLDAAEASAKEALKASDENCYKALVEINDLRDRLRDAEMHAERMRGYLDALADAAPPVMVPEARTPAISELRGHNGTYQPVSSYSRPKGWWSR